MLKYQIVETRANDCSAFSKAPQDVFAIASSEGFSAIRLWNIEGCSIIVRAARKIIVVAQCISLCWRVGIKSTILVQLPCFTLGGTLTFKVFSYIKRLKHITLISLIHDVDEFRFGQGEANSGKCRLSPLVALSDFLIVHNERMKNWYVEHGVRAEKVFSLDIFDYLIGGTIQPKELPQTSKNIVIAGTLNPEVVGFVKYLKNYKDLKWELYGPKYDAKVTAASNVHYNGCISSDKLPSVINGSFGLIWYGDSTGSCNGYLREYLKIINPHKLSLYLAAGMPVVVWAQSAAADFVRSNNVGFCINNLDELSDILDKMTPTEYDHLLSNVKEVSAKIRTGYFTRRALSQCCF